jgi:hypothetical protein
MMAKCSPSASKSRVLPRERLAAYSTPQSATVTIKNRRFNWFSGPFLEHRCAAISTAGVNEMRLDQLQNG